VSTKPKILIVALENWAAIARLPKALQQAGFEVAALCHQDSYLGSTRYLDRLFTYSSYQGQIGISREFINVVQNWNANIIVAGDEKTVLFFHAIVQLHEENFHIPSSVLEVMNHSFGNFKWQLEATSKRLTLERAKTLGLRTPRLASPVSLDDAIKHADSFGWPVVLKKSTSFAGHGVTFCDNEQELAAAYHKYSEDCRHRGTFKSFLFQTGLFQNWTELQADKSFTVNETIYGQSAAVAVVAVDGQILGQSAALKTECHPDKKSPSSVMRMISHPGMFETAKKLVQYWGATGFLGFDFVVDDNDVAYLIECNPRPNPLSYMGEQQSGCDLCQRWHHYLAGEKIPLPSAPSDKFVAHFPNEWRRDPCSSYLRDAYHDVPWDDPRLFCKLVADSQKVKRRFTAESLSYPFRLVRRCFSEVRDNYMMGKAFSH
jgi:predicted ATP-grasp superfamily ATP-dependent carboligase